MTGHGFGIDGFGGFAKWSQREQDEYKSGWKVLTLMMGMNDALTSGAACSDDKSQRDSIAHNFEDHMTALFDYLVANEDGLFSNIYVNLMTLFGVSEMGLQNDKEAYCKITGSSILKHEFPCMRGGGDGGGGSDPTGGVDIGITIP